MTQDTLSTVPSAASEPGGAGVFLKPQAKLEPLVCGWYAWPHLVAPAQLALNLTYRFIPLLQSFIKNPAVHVAAAADENLFGGPFVHLAKDQVPNVQELLAQTEARCSKLTTLARDLKQFDRSLLESANGYSLSEFYSKLPESLGGLTEVLYDLNNHPKIRLHEELLYDEDLTAGTQELRLSLTPEGERPFFLSTPRLDSAHSQTFTLPFTDARWDVLGSMRTRAAPFDEVAAQFGIAADRRPAFAEFFTATPPPRRTPEYLGSGVRVRYFGHACVLVQTAQTSILIDPMFAWETERQDGRHTFCDLPEFLDYVVLSHNHQDHCAPEMLLPLRHRVGRVVVPQNNSGSLADPSMKLLLGNLGFRNVDVVSAFQQIPFSGGVITSLPFPGEHVDLDVHTRHGIHIEANGRRLLFLVDSDGWDSVLFRRIARRTGRKLDALFLGMECHGAPLTWLYGPLMTRSITRRNDESRRLSGLDSARAWRVVQEFEAANIFVYAMGQEPWLKYIMGLQYKPDSIQLKEVAAFLELCRDANLPAEHLYISKDLEY